MVTQAQLKVTQCHPTAHHWLHICPLPVPSQSASRVCSLIGREGTCSCLMAGEEYMKKTKSEFSKR